MKRQICILVLLLMAGIAFGQVLQQPVHGTLQIESSDPSMGVECADNGILEMTGTVNNLTLQQEQLYLGQTFQQAVTSSYVEEMYYDQRELPQIDWSSTYCYKEIPRLNYVSGIADKQCLWIRSDHDGSE